MLTIFFVYCSYIEIFIAIFGAGNYSHMLNLIFIIMRKILVLLLVSLVCTLSLQAQKKIQGDYFSISTTDSKWSSEDVVMDEGQAISLFQVNGNKVIKAIVITAIPGKIDAADFIGMQREADNPVFKGAKFDGVEKGKFKTYSSVSQGFTSNFNGSKTWGEMVAFNTAKSTYFILMYATSSDADFDALLSAFTIKK